jgi:hypothetical protein
VQSYGYAPHLSENNSADANLSHGLWPLLSCHNDHLPRHIHYLAVARFWKHLESTNNAMVSLLLSVGFIALAVKKQDRNGGSVRSLSSMIPKQDLISFLKTFHT